MQPSVEKMSPWDERFFSLGKLVSEWSEDRSRKVGAVVVTSSNEVISLGFNGLPRNVDSNVDYRHSKIDGEKYHWFEHAERNAIFNCSKLGISTLNCRIYTTNFPCSDCTRAIIQCGIVEICTFMEPKGDERFKRGYEISREMLRETQVRLRIFEDL